MKIMVVLSMIYSPLFFIKISLVHGIFPEVALDEGLGLILTIVLIFPGLAWLGMFAPDLLRVTVELADIDLNTQRFVVMISILLYTVMISCLVDVFTRFIRTTVGQRIFFTRPGNGGKAQK